jgi:hypothetical protein
LTRRVILSGQYLWNRLLDGYWNSIIIDAQQNIYTTGFFSGPVDFDPGPGIFNLNGTPSGQGSTFMVKLDSAANFIWAKKLNGSMNQYGK